MHFHIRIPTASRLTVLMLTAGMAFYPRARGATAPPRPITLQLGAHAGRRIPRDFTGFSIEVFSAAHRYIGPAGELNGGFLQLMRNLGAGTLRLGGHSSDISCWRPLRAPRPRGCEFVLTRADLLGWAQASARTGWGVITGLNLAQNAPAWAARTAGAVAWAMRQTPHSHWLGVEPGNEPDAFAGQAFYGNVTTRSKAYSLADFEREWSRYARAIHAASATRRIPVYGPAFCCRWLRHGLRPFLAQVGHPNLNVVTVHAYAATRCGGHHPSFHELLSARRLRQFSQRLRHWVRIAHAARFPLQMDETNSVSCQGEDGISNGFGATLWGLRWLFMNFQSGVRAVNFHEGGYNHGRGYYYDAVRVRLRWHARAAERYRNQIWPLYYAMYAFAHLAEGRRWLPVKINSSADLIAYAVRGRHYDTVFLLPGADEAATTVAIAPIKPADVAARVLWLRASSLAARQVRYGGARFSGRTGKLNRPPHWHRLNPRQGQYQLTAPVAALAIVRIARPA